MKAPHLFFLAIAGIGLLSCNQNMPENTFTEQDIRFTFPEEGEAHEGTWLQWPHHHQYGIEFREHLDPAWVEMTKALSSDEKVHIVAYDNTEKERITKLLDAQSVNLDQVDFWLFKTDDFWVRDNGPIFVRDHTGSLVILDWGFNGWGNKAASANCNQIPEKIGAAQNRLTIDLNAIMINEGGSIEVDGNGSLMACKSSILNKNRNPGMSQSEAEQIFHTYLGVSNFIWLDGRVGLEITDQHIDGFARFGNPHTIVTMSEKDLRYYDVKASDIKRLYSATNKDGKAYAFLKLPLTQNNVETSYGDNLGIKGSYCNYYISNAKVLVPIYEDPHDEIAINLLQTLYPDREVIGIDSRNIYANGGMIHCVTQQQPLD